MRRYETVGLLAVLFVAFGLRLAYFAEQHREPVFRVPLIDARFNDYWARGWALNDWSLRGDETAYGDAPRLMIRSRPFFRPPGYPCFLAALFALTRGNHELTVLLQMLLGTVNVLLAFLLARKLFGTVAGLVCAGLMALYWPFIYFESQLEEPVLLSFLMLVLAHAIVALAHRSSLPLGFAAGTVVGLLALARPNALVLFPVLLLWIVFVWHKLVPASRLLSLLVAMPLGTVIAVVPATIRNWRASREIVLISANTGINLHIGNHEGASGFFVSDTPEIQGFETSFDYPRIVEQLQERLGHPLSYSQASAYFAARALRFIFTHPETFLRLTLKRMILLWGPTEIGHNREIQLDRAASPLLRANPVNFPLALALAVTGIAAAGATIRRSGSLPTPTPLSRPVANSVLAFTSCVFVYLTSFSVFFVTALFRIPVVPLLLVLGSYGVVFLWRLWRHGPRTKAMRWTSGLVLVYLTARFPVIACEPDRAKWHYDRALAAQLLGQDEVAVVEYAEVLRVVPDDAAARTNLGTIRARQGRFEEALEHFRVALGQHPSNALARRGCAVCLIMLNRAADALAVLGPNHGADPRTTRLLGICHGELGDHEAAVSSLRKALDVDPHRADTLHNLQRALLLAGLLEPGASTTQPTEPPAGCHVTPNGFVIPPDW